MFNLILSILLFVFFPQKDLETGIKKYLSERLQGYSKWNYSILTNLNNLARKNLILEIDKERELQIKGNYGYIPIKEKGIIKSSSTFITVKLNLYKEVLCATRKISAGSELNPVDFELIEKEISTLKEEPVQKFFEITGCTAKLNIGKDMILLQSMIKQNNLIKIGDEITAVYFNGGVEISFSAKARTEGKIGDQIQIVNKDNKIYRAKIKDAGTVIITEL